MDDENKETMSFLVSVDGDDQYRCIAVDETYLNLTGIPQEHFINRPLNEIFPSLEVDYLVEQYGKAIVSRKPFRYDTRTAFKGNTAYLRTTLVPVFGEEGICTHLIGISEVTERSD